MLTKAEMQQGLAEWGQALKVDIAGEVPF